MTRRSQAQRTENTLLRFLLGSARTPIAAGRRPDSCAPVSGTGKREGGGGLGAGTGAAGPAPKACPDPNPSARPSLRVGYASLQVSSDDLAPLASSIAVESDSGWRLHSQSDPSGRNGLLYVSIVRSSTRYSSVLRRLEARTGGANPSDPRRSRETPRLVSGRSLQPCPLLVQPPDQRERFPLTSPSHSTLDLTTLATRARPSSS